MTRGHRFFSPVIEDPFPSAAGIPFFLAIDTFNDATAENDVMRFLFIDLKGKVKKVVTATRGSFSQDKMEVFAWSVAQSADGKFFWVGTDTSSLADSEVSGQTGYRLMKFSSAGVLLTYKNHLGATKIPFSSGVGSGKKQFLALADDGEVWVGTWENVNPKNFFLRRHDVNGDLIATYSIPATQSSIRSLVNTSCAVIAGRQAIHAVFEEDNNPPGPTSFEWRVVNHRLQRSDFTFMTEMRSDPVGPDQGSDPIKFALNHPAGPDRTDTAAEAYLPIGNANQVNMAVWKITTGGAFVLGVAIDPNDFGSGSQLVRCTGGKIYRTAPDNLAPFSGEDELRFYDFSADQWESPDPQRLTAVGEAVTERFFPAHYKQPNKVL